MNPLEARTKIRTLGDQAQAVVKDTRLTPAEKMTRLTGYQSELRAAQDTLGIAGQAGQFASGGDSIDYNGSAGMFGAKSFGGPSFAASEEQVRALHQAATTKQSLRVQTKAAFDLDPSIPSLMQPQVVAFRREPTRVASLFPSGSMPGPSVEYLRHISTTGTAATVAAGAAKPELTPVFDQVIATARKIAAHIGVTDESLFDFGATGTYVNSELVNAITAAENLQLLNGNGTPPNLQGILGTSGVLTRTQAIAPETAIDALELAANDLRTGATFCEPDAVVMHPNDWSAIRLAKNSYGEYLLAPPVAGDGATLWGLPVVLTTQITAKTVLVGSFAIGGSVLFRQGVTIETGSNGLDWTSNITRFRAEERLALQIFRPSAFVKVTLL